MFRVVAFVLAIVLMMSEFFVIHSAAVHTTSNNAATPKVPPFSNIYELHFSQVIPAETTTLDCSIAQDGPGLRYAQQCNTTDGTFSHVYRFDLNATFIFFPHVDGTMKCWGSKSSYPAGSSLPGPNYHFFPYAHQSAFEGRLLNYFRIPVGRYYQSVALDAETGFPKIIMNGNMDDVHGIVTSFKNGTVDESRFDLPEACGNFFSAAEKKTNEASTRLGFNYVQQMLKSVSRFNPAKILHHGQHPLASSVSPSFDKSPLFLPEDLFGKREVPEELFEYINSKGLVTTTTKLSIDNRKYFTPVRNQGLCGCCWAFGTSALMEAFVNIQLNRTWVENTKAWLAPQSLVDCVEVLHPAPHDFIPRGCFGGNPADAMNWIAQNGIAWEADYPFTSGMNAKCKISSNQGASSSLSSVPVIKPVSRGLVLPSLNVTAMEAAIVKFGGILTVINDDYNFQYFGGHGVFNDPTCTPGVAHIITLVGFGHDEESGLDYWLVKNSYGAAWSDAGYIKMAKGVNMCGMELYPFVGIPKPIAHE